MSELAREADSLSLLLGDQKPTKVTDKKLGRCGRGNRSGL